MRSYLKIHPQPCQCPFCGSERRWAKKQSELASARGYTSWVLVLNAKREPIVKRCNSRETEIEMMKEMRRLHPTATVIHAQLNPGDCNELWATSEAHWLAVAEV